MRAGFPSSAGWLFLRTLVGGVSFYEALARARPELAYLEFYRSETTEDSHIVAACSLWSLRCLVVEACDECGHDPGLVDGILDSSSAASLEEIDDDGSCLGPPDPIPTRERRDCGWCGGARRFPYVCYATLMVIQRLTYVTHMRRRPGELPPVYDSVPQRRRVGTLPTLDITEPSGRPIGSMHGGCPTESRLSIPHTERRGTGAHQRRFPRRGLPLRLRRRVVVPVLVRPRLLLRQRSRVPRSCSSVSLSAAASLSR